MPPLPWAQLQRHAIRSTPCLLLPDFGALSGLPDAHWLNDELIEEQERDRLRGCPSSLAKRVDDSEPDASSWLVLPAFVLTPTAGQEKRLRFGWVWCIQRKQQAGPGGHISTFLDKGGHIS